MGLESFYGGRVGAPFIIVYRFDAYRVQDTDPDRIKYKCKYYAVSNKDRSLYVVDGNGKLIEKSKTNYNNYYWALTPLNGANVRFVTDKNSASASEDTIQLDTSPAEGMVNTFQQGADSTDKVNYYEYVIIDTVDKDNPDNGKVYRRGLDYGKSDGGAEYIGQIVGPQGGAPELELVHYDEVDKTGAYTELTYSNPDDLLPGVEKNAEGEIIKFNNNIEWIYATIRDAAGAVEGCRIGFKIPTLVIDFEATSIEPHDEDYRRGTSGEYYYENLISEDNVEYQDGKWMHPFYQKWQVKVPSGLHGIDSTNIELVHTVTMPAEYRKSLYPESEIYGVQVYTDSELTEEYGIITDSVEVLRDPSGERQDEGYIPIYDINTNSCRIINYDDNPLYSCYYVDKQDCYMDILRYRETDFEDCKSGQLTFYDIGKYNNIQRITLSHNGILTAFYNCIAEPQQLEEVLRWIDTEDTQGITIDEDGTVTVYYNTLDIVGNHEFSKFDNVLNWVTSITLQDDGLFTILYNNDTAIVGYDDDDNPIYGDTYQTILRWINYIKILDDGTIKFYWNTQNPELDYPDEDLIVFKKFIKKIDNISIETVAEDSVYEGTGDQKIHITYNTTDDDGNKEVDIIGNPLNYIMETTVCYPSLNFPNAPYSHLLVYYSDPALRALYSDKWVTYPSTKVILRYDETTGKPIYITWEEWVDLGNIRGAQGGVHVVKHVENMSDLIDPTTGEGIPPEKLTDSLGNIIQPDGAGWSVTYKDVSSSSSITQLLCYNYETKIWYSIGSVDSSLIDPLHIIVKSEADNEQQPDPLDVISLKDNGIWLGTEIGYYAF